MHVIPAGHLLGSAAQRIQHSLRAEPGLIPTTEMHSSGAWQVAPPQLSNVDGVALGAGGGEKLAGAGGTAFAAGGVGEPQPMTRIDRATEVFIRRPYPARRCDRRSGGRSVDSVGDSEAQCTGALGSAFVVHPPASQLEACVVWGDEGRDASRIGRSKVGGDPRGEHDVEPLHDMPVDHPAAGRGSARDL